MKTTYDKTAIIPILLKRARGAYKAGRRSDAARIYRAAFRRGYFPQRGDIVTQRGGLGGHREIIAVVRGYTSRGNLIIRTLYKTREWGQERVIQPTDIETN